MKKIITLALCLFSLAAVAQEQEQFDANKFLDSLNFQTGEIALSNGVATVNLPDGYVYLSPQDAERLLVEGWGNPPGQNVLGMILPSDRNPFSANAWAVTLEYLEDGYVSDEDADKIDYAELLQGMKDEAAEASKERIKQGYDSMELIGWAASPHYNAETKKLYWAKEYKFGDNETNTLNYNIRMLGRKGVLVLNFIGGMEQLPEINQRLDDVLAMAEFNRGMQYSDFDPDIDTVAAYGIGALVAGKLAAKAGLFAVALVFLKKFGVLIVVLLGGLFAKLFRRKKAEPAA
jgi:uncharacterized membrane-anchored protein